MNKKIIMNSKEYKYRGITLISLVITIIVLIILASVAIYLSLGNNGMFTRAKEAKEVTNKQEATEKINLKITTAQMNKYAEKQKMPTLQELADVLYEDNEIEYVALESKVADKEKIEIGDSTSIYTKLNKYPYEFEINSKLQLASINGIKIANNKTTNETILWEGKTENGSEIELKDDLNKYNFIEIYFSNIQNKSAAGIIKFDVKKIIEIGVFDIYDFCGWTFFGKYEYDKESNKIINVGNGYYNHSEYHNKFTLEIYKIVGY